MKKTININLGSKAFIIDEDAYKMLSNYIKAIEKKFSSKEGHDDIMEDIEYRMAEILNHHSKGRDILNLSDIQHVQNTMGNPSVFGGEDPVEESIPSYSNSRKRYTRKLFRNPDDKKIAGVCSGLAAYFGMEDTLIIRIIFVVLFFVTGISFIAYIVLWIAVSEAKTSADKLSMYGEPVTIDSIAQKVEKDLNTLTDTIKKYT